MVRLADFLPEADVRSGGWGADSILNNTVDATHLMHRLHLIGGQAVALTVLNDSFISLELPTHKNLHAAQKQARALGIITARQGDILVRLNRMANNAKHQI